MVAEDSDSEAHTMPIQRGFIFVAEEEKARLRARRLALPDHREVRAGKE